MSHYLTPFLSNLTVTRLVFKDHFSIFKESHLSLILRITIFAILTSFLLVGLLIFELIRNLRDVKMIKKRSVLLGLVLLSRILFFKIFVFPIFEILSFSLICKDYGSGIGIRSDLSKDLPCIFADDFWSDSDFYLSTVSLCYLLIFTADSIFEDFLDYNTRIWELGANLR